MPDGDSRNISVRIEHNGWHKLPSVERLVSETITDTFRYMAHPATGVTVLLSDDQAIQALNHQFRGKNMPTNILSFPSGEEGYLGDLIVAYETTAAEATQQKKPLANHLAHLVVHGTLHLLGFDHEEEDEADMMEDTEARILAARGIANPYQVA